MFKVTGYMDTLYGRVVFFRFVTEESLSEVEMLLLEQPLWDKHFQEEESP